jgi:hypothetical protein
VTEGDWNDKPVIVRAGRETGNRQIIEGIASKLYFFSFSVIFFGITVYSE